MTQQETQLKHKKKRRLRLPPGAGSVHKVSGQRRKPWRARVQVGVELDPATGNAVRKYINLGYFATEIEALDALSAYRKDPFDLEAANATFSDVFELWKASRYDGLSKSTRFAYNSAFNNSAPLHNMKMRDIRTIHMERVMMTVTGGISLQRRLKTLWGLLFDFAMERDIISKNYADYVRTRDKYEQAQRTDIPAEHRAMIWQLANAGDRRAQLALIYIYTGMRASELLEMKKTDVNIDTRIMIGGNKTAAGINRRIPIHNCIVPFIKKMMQEDSEYLVSWKKQSGERVKFTYNRYLTTFWTPLMEQLGFEEYTPHYTRHTCATMLREVNVPEDLRKLILGHSNPDITNHYTHFSDAALVAEIDKLPVDDL